MTAITHIASPHTGPATAISRYLKAEWTKLRTLPSTWRTTVFAATLALSFTIIVDLAEASHWHANTASQRHAFDPTSASLFGVIIAATLLGALAVRTVTAEYATGMIRATFSAMPSRQRVLAAKAATVAVLVLPIALLTELAGFTLGQRIFAGEHMQVALTHPGVPRAILFGAIATSLVAIIGVGLGGLIRHTAGATTTLVMIIIGDVTLGQLLPAGLRQYLPGTTIQAAITGHRSGGLLTPGAAILVLATYAAMALAAALVRVARSDA
jgi:ABC-type transport system involved in multi-copper enzyme maturation permease subunit